MAKLIMTTKEMENQKAWLESRGAGIGGSDAGTIAGLNSWKSPYQLWLEKTDQVEAEDISDKECVYWGHALEQLVADRFCELTGKKVRRSGLLQSDEHDFMLASPDRMVVGENAGLECKTTNSFAKDEWEGDKVPASYYCQCQHYMAVTGSEKWYIAVLIGGNHFIWKEIPRNEDDIKSLIEIESAFWQHVVQGTMPEIDGSESCSNALRERFKGGAVEPIKLPSEAEGLAQEIEQMKEAKKETDKRIKLAQNRLCVILGDNEIGIAGDFQISWKPQTRVSLDSKKLKAEKPEIWEAYKKTSTSRIFKIKA